MSACSKNWARHPQLLPLITCSLTQSSAPGTLLCGGAAPSGGLANPQLSTLSDSEVQKFRTSEFQSLTNSVVQKFRNSGFQTFLISGIQGFSQEFVNSEIRTSEIRMSGFQVQEFINSKRQEFQNFRNSGLDSEFQHFINSGIRFKTSDVRNSGVHDDFKTSEI